MTAAPSRVRGALVPQERSEIPLTIAGGAA